MGWRKARRLRKQNLDRGLVVAASTPEKARELKAKLAAWRDEVQAVMPKPAEPGNVAPPAKRKRTRRKG